ncbi:hypothetical protein CARUB_v10006298mg [Capsella rubella]|uniref:Cystatin domain-containing protein n=1 Tax=Capsella rubella TaxID=81985 RepID=R0GLY4_9BRAS|nr:hypothetical protein CARUB_v10006298mg [Capsella rubella]
MSLRGEKVIMKFSLSKYLIGYSGHAEIRAYTASHTSSTLMPDLGVVAIICDNIPTGSLLRTEHTKERKKERKKEEMGSNCFTTLRWLNLTVTYVCYTCCTRNAKKGREKRLKKKKKTLQQAGIEDWDMVALEPEPPQVEETTVSSSYDPVISSGFIPKEEWYAAVHYNPPSGWTDESDDEVDPVLEQEYYNQVWDSDGSNLQLVHVDKYISRFCALMTYHITAQAIDPANDSRFTFQTCVTSSKCKNDEDLRIVAEVCRIKPKIQGTGDEIKLWDDEAIDDLYKGNLSEWVALDALMSSSEHDQFYEMQESDIREHNWLNLYTEAAFYSLWQGHVASLESCVPLQIKKVIVQTREAVESKEKLKAGNATFYICFRGLNPPHGSPQDHRAIIKVKFATPLEIKKVVVQTHEAIESKVKLGRECKFYISYSPCGLIKDHRTVVRKNTDGDPAHLCHEVKRWFETC